MPPQGEKCPHCGDSKFISSGFTEQVVHGKRSLYPYAQPCYCEINHQIDSRFPLLAKFPPVPLEDAHRAHKLYEGRNIRFSGKEDLFLYAVKAYFLEGFIQKDYLVLEGRRIVDEYHAPQRDGSRLTIDALNQYDLLVILMTSYVKYETLQRCVLDVVKNRLRLARSTWLYAESEEAMKRSSDFSEGLNLYLKEYSTVDIGKGFKYVGYTQGKTKEIGVKKEADVQQSLGSDL